MAFSSVLSSIFICLTSFLFITTHQAAAQLAPAPSTSPPNLTAILSNAGQFTTLLRLLRSTQVLVQLESQLNYSFNGLTFFAPTDNAFSNLKAGILNSLNNQDQVELVLCHVLPPYYTLTRFQTASNPLQTQGSSSTGSDKLNVTSIGNNQFNVSTGVVETQVNNVLYSSFPLAVFPVDKVLLPYSLFGAKPPASPPSPTPTPTPTPTPAVKSPVGSSSTDGPSTDGGKTNSAISLKRFGWSFGVLIVGLKSVVRGFFIA